MVTFYITKIKENYRQIKTSKISDWFEYKREGIIGYLILRRKGWKLMDVRFFLITDLCNSWKALNTSDKINVISIIITIIMFLIDNLKLNLF